MNGACVGMARPRKPSDTRAQRCRRGGRSETTSSARHGDDIGVADELSLLIIRLELEGGDAVVLVASCSARSDDTGAAVMPKTLYADSVFIKYPFDTEYGALLDAMIFAVHDCGSLLLGPVSRCPL
jgi:hypothetical protein